MTDSWFRARLRAYKPLHAAVFIATMGVCSATTETLRGEPLKEILGVTASMMLGATIGCALILWLKSKLDED